jgi:hypothetical protein
VNIFVANNNHPPKLFRKNLRESEAKASNYLQVRVVGRAPNTQATGTRAPLTVTDRTQFREVLIGTNYLFQNELLANFGIGTAKTVDEFFVKSPPSLPETTRADNVGSDQVPVLTQDNTGAPCQTTGGPR